jgi:hypothetical protein
MTLLLNSSYSCSLGCFKQHKDNCDKLKSEEAGFFIDTNPDSGRPREDDFFFLEEGEQVNIFSVSAEKSSTT